MIVVVLRRIAVLACTAIMITNVVRRIIVIAVT